jgi:hypothetical protein
MLRLLVIAAGIGQLILAVGSLSIPRVLDWRRDLARLRPLTRQVFWVYAGYILATNVCFALLSIFMPAALLDSSPLAAAVCGFIAAYWLARLVIQFACFDRSAAPPGVVFRLLEAALVGLFIYLTLVYGMAALANLGVVVP